MQAPEISVLMGVYYRRADTTLLECSVSSILTQSITDFEFLICDDGSTEEAKLVLDRMAQEDDRICLLRKGNLFSLSQKLNACLRQAKGMLIARMDDDDYSAPTRLVNQLVYLKEHPNVSFVGCNVNLRCNAQVIGERRFPEFPKIRDFYMTQPFIHPTLMFRKDALLAVKGYSEDKHCILCEDYDLLLRLYTAGYCGANIQTALFDYTVPETAKGNRRFTHRLNESVTRYRRFHELKCLHKSWPYVFKPLVVGLLPESILKKIKNPCSGFIKK